MTLVHFEKPLKTKKTSNKRNTIDPVFNESVSFNVTTQQLESTSIVITVWDHNSKSKDDFVGRIVLGRHGSGPHEFTHWNRMLHSQRSPVAQWHSLRSRQDCDQVSPASIAVLWNRWFKAGQPPSTHPNSDWAVFSYFTGKRFDVTRSYLISF